MRLSGMAILALVFLLFSCEKTDESSEVLRKVIYQKPIAAADEITRAFAGLARAKFAAKLSFKVPGNLEYIDLNVGDRVKKGDILAKLDSIDYSLHVQESEATLSQTKAESRHADANYARIRELYETHSTSLNELDATRATSESAKAKVEAMQKKLALVQSRMNYTVLTAPNEGQIAAIFVEKNENVQNGQPIITLNSISNLEVRVFIPENLISNVSYGDKVEVSFDALLEKNLEGVVTETGVISTAGNAFSVTVELADISQDVLPGMSAEVVFKFKNMVDANSIFVPSSAVISKGQVHSVFVVIPIDLETAIVEKRTVTIGNLTTDGFEIKSGLAKNDFIVIAGANSLVDGQRVKL